MSTLVSRRRFIGISAAAAGLALLPHGVQARPGAVTWRGRALGASAEIIIHHQDRQKAESLVARAVAALDELERVFSLYRADSALCELNRSGALAFPPPELVDILTMSRNVWQLTQGAFDPSVQPLWTLYAQHYAGPDADPAGPPRRDVEQALQLVGFDAVAFGRDRVALARRGMALTLNGIAQGFITDRIVELLRAGGIENTLVDLGEIRALGTHGDGTPWRAGVAQARDTQLVLRDRALATSAAGGFRFAGLHSPGHILDPRNAKAGDAYESVSVIAHEAAMADALSTAFNLMSVDEISAVLRATNGAEVFILSADGVLRPLAAA